MGSRIEHDTLGAIDVPAWALFGPRTERARRLFVGGTPLGERPALLIRLARVKRAAALANGSTGALPTDAMRAIDRAARLVELQTVAAEHFPVDPLLGGGWVAVNANLNEVIARLATAESAASPSAIEPADVNRSQSTADVCHTAVRLAAHDSAVHAIEVSHALVTTLHAVADSFGDQTTMSRTCLQDALPVPAGHRFLGSAIAVARAADDLDQARRALLAITLGGTVVGDGAGASPAYRRAVVPQLAALCGLDLVPHPSAPSALQHTDDLLAISAATDRLARSVAKLAADLRLLSAGPTGGWGEVRLPHVLDGSTYFTGKRNPIVPETVMQVAIEVAAHHHAVQLATERAELDLNVFDGLAALHTIDGLDLLAPAITLLREHAVDGLTIDADRCDALSLATRKEA